MKLQKSGLLLAIFLLSMEAEMLGSSFSGQLTPPPARNFGTDTNSLPPQNNSNVEIDDAVIKWVRNNAERIAGNIGPDVTLEKIKEYALDHNIGMLVDLTDEEGDFIIGAVVAAQEAQDNEPLVNNQQDQSSQDLFKIVEVVSMLKDMEREEVQASRKSREEERRAEKEEKIKRDSANRELERRSKIEAEQQLGRTLEVVKFAKDAQKEQKRADRKARKDKDPFGDDAAEAIRSMIEESEIAISKANSAIKREERRRKELEQAAENKQNRKTIADSKKKQRQIEKIEEELSALRTSLEINSEKWDKASSLLEKAAFENILNRQMLQSQGLEEQLEKLTKNTK
ncbi:MAG: hypothetical protein WC747_03860 [Candidatus Babeliales bacterium]|jgi:hypothetical protein